MRKTYTAIALAALAGLTVSGCLRMFFDPDPDPGPLVSIPPAKGAFVAAYNTALENRKPHESLELADFLRAEMTKSGANDIEAYLTADGFHCESQICSFVEVRPRKYLPSGAYDPDFVVTVWAIEYSSSELNDETQLRGHTTGTIHKAPRPK